MQCKSMQVNATHCYTSPCCCGADRDLEVSYFTYFTNWSLMLLSLAGLVAAANTLRHMARRRRAGQALLRRGLPAAAKAAQMALEGAPAAR